MLNKLQADNSTTREYVWLFFILLIIFALRLPILHVSVIDWDESVYFKIAQDIVNGGVPYQTSWDTKGPFLFFIFVPIILLFDDSIPALRVFTTVYLLLSIFFLYRLARKFFRGFACVIPPLIYGLFFITPAFGGFASNGELFMMLPVILALLCFLNYEDKGRALMLVLSGLFSAVAFFMKATAIFSVLVVPLFILYRNLKPGSPDIKSFFKETVYYSLGFAAVVIALTLYFGVHGALHDFYYTYFVVNNKYTSVVPVKDVLFYLYYFLYGTILVNHDLITLLAIAFSILILIYLVRKKFGKEEKDRLLFIIALAVLSFVGVLWGRRMYPHYYLQMGLPYSLLIALGISKLGLNRRYVEAFTIVIFAVFVIQSPITQTVKDMKSTDEDWFESGASYRVADYIRSNTSKDDTVLLIGGQPIIYFLADRRAPIKHFWWPKHQAIMQEILNLKDSVPQELTSNKPEYVVFYDGKHKEEINHLDYLDKFINDNYSLEKEIDGYKFYRVKN